MVAKRGKGDKAVMKPVGAEPVKRIFQRLRIGQQQCALSEIVEKKCRQDDAKPCQSDRHAAKVSHVGVHSFTAGHGQECGAKDRESDQ